MKMFYKSISVFIILFSLSGCYKVDESIEKIDLAIELEKKETSPKLNLEFGVKNNGLTLKDIDPKKYEEMLLVKKKTEFDALCKRVYPCNSSKNEREIIINNEYLKVDRPTYWGTCAYKDNKGEIIIPFGKYERCITPFFKDIAIVTIIESDGYTVGIDRDENVLYEVDFFHVVPAPSLSEDGLFRIKKDGKYGYADEWTGKIVIEARFENARAFHDGKVLVSDDKCEKLIDEMTGHTICESDNWYYVDLKGEKIEGLAVDQDDFRLDD